MGSFAALYNYSSHGGDWQFFDDGVTQGYQIYDGMSGSITYATSSQFTLDSGPIININDLPSGFEITNVDPENSGTSLILVSRNPANIPIVDSIRALDLPSIITITSVTTPGSSIQITAIPYGTDPWLTVGYHTLTGTYRIFNVTINSPHPNLPNNVIPNDPIVVNSPTPVPGGADPNNPDLTDVDHIELKLPDNTLILIFIFELKTPTQLIFTWPTGIIPGTIVVVTGVTFWGTIALGSFTVIIENGSGIYQIVRGKIGDTIYLKSDVSNDTKQSIVLPRARIGFIGG